MNAQPRILYSCREFAAMLGMSYEALRKEANWRRFGGKKVRGRIKFPERARTEIAEGRL